MQQRNEDVLLDPTTGRGQGLEGAAPTRLKSLLADAPETARRLLAGTPDDQADASLAFRSVGAIVAKALNDHDTELFAAGIRSFAAIWSLGRPEAMFPVTTPGFEASLWERLVIELYAAGGLAARRERWAELRQVVAEPATSSGDRSWLRQGQVASSRASSYPDESIVAVAARRLREVDGDENGDSLASVCQFDLLAGLVICETDRHGFYPNCAVFSESLVEDLVIRRLRHDDSPLRRYVFSGDEAGLREALRYFDAKARSQAAYARRAGQDWRWRAFADGRTWSFIDEGHILEEWEGGSGWVSPG